MQIYNTLTRKKQEFKPIKKGEVLMYHCGPTVYWTQHIGNMRAMVLADLVVRSFKYLGYNVKLVRNYTDVGHLTSDSDEGEDKMESAAKRENLDPLKIAEKYIKIFEADIHALNVPDANVKPRATECVKEDIIMIKKLLENGYAYKTDLAVYFDVSKFENYGELSGQKLEDKLQGAGKAEVEDKNKKNPADFALWFFKAGKHKNALQTWSSPWGHGFPGWHLECSVMAKKFLSDTIDIHMGGVEHISLHHTNEIAQSEAGNGVKFVNYWLHNEHLLVDNSKMSKSEGTSYSLADIKNKNFDPLILRYFFLNAHYKSKQNFTWQALEAAQNGLEKLKNNILNLGDEKGKIDEEFKNKFIEYISDDFNIPQAFALISEILKSDLNNQDKLATILDFDKIFGLKLDDIKINKIKIPNEVQKLIEQRKKARQEKNWPMADQLRIKIDQMGYVIKDEKNNFSIWKKIK
ncbi:MAG: cysteine--tRNA ligase [Patescibacteria group bacterium]